LVSCLIAVLVLADSFISFAEAPPAGPPLRVPPPVPKVKTKQVEEMRKQTKPRPRVGPIRISGHVTVPDGRGLGGIKVILYEVRGGGFMHHKEVVTTKAGYYLINLGGKWFNREVKLVPKHPAFREGEGFSVQCHKLKIIKAKMPNHNFEYIGPLPDLECANAFDPPEIVRCAMVSQTSTGVEIAVSIANHCERSGCPDADPFKVKLHGRFGDKSEIIVDFPSGISGFGRAGGFDITKYVFLPGLRAGDVVVEYIDIDIENSVIESNEMNNRVYGPFY